MILLISNIVLLLWVISLSYKQENFSIDVKDEVGRLFSEFTDSLRPCIDVKIDNFNKESNIALENHRNFLNCELDKEKRRLVLQLENQVSDFKILMDKEYLAQYEKMKKNPPRPRKVPRKKDVEPPRKYRSLDDE